MDLLNRTARTSDDDGLWLQRMPHKGVYLIFRPQPICDFPGLHVPYYDEAIITAACEGLPIGGEYQCIDGI